MSDPRRYSAVPATQANPENLRSATDRLKDGYELLVGHRGTMQHKAVTLQDLIDLGLVTEAEIAAKLKIKFRNDRGQ